MSWFWFSNQKNELKLTDFLAKEIYLIIWLGKQAEISWFSSQEIKLRLAEIF